MWKIIRRNPRAFAYALLIHVAVILFLVVGIDWHSDTPVQPQVNVVQATMIDMTKIEAEKQKQKQAEEAERRKEEQARKEELERQQAAEAEKQRQQELKKKQEAERQAKIEQEKAEVEKKRLAEQKRKEEAKKKAAEEAKLKAAEEAKKKAAEEAKRKAAEEAKKKAAEETKRKAAEEAKRKAEAERKAQEEALQAQMEAEQNQREMARYVVVIRQQIERNWLRPQTSREGLKCTVQVRLIPGGDVIGVSVVQSSGDPAFDRSVENAVHKASPLNVPSEPRLFELFRDLRLVFDPSA